MDGPDWRLVGMDPSGIKFHQYYPAHIQLIPDLFSAQRFRGEPSFPLSAREVAEK
jgi:hypothetical protein